MMLCGFPFCFRFPQLVTLLTAWVAAASHAQSLPPGKLSLPVVLDRVIATDRTIAVADLEVRRGVVEKLRASSRLAPRLSADASSGWQGDATRRDNSTAQTSGSTEPVAAVVPQLTRERRWTRSRSNSQSIGLNLSQPILDLTVRPAKRQAELIEKIAHWQLRLRLREVLFEVTSQYFDVLRYSELVEQNQQTLTQTAELIRQAEGRLAAQEVIESDVLQARVSDEQARRAVMEAETSRDLAKTQLAITLDFLPDPSFELMKEATGRLPANSIREAITTAQQQREEIRVAQLTLNRTQAERDEIRARFAPTMDVQLGGDLATGSTLDRRDSWNAGISLSWAIFDRGQRMLDLKDNALQLNQDDFRVQDASKTVSHDVVDAWFTLERYKKRLASLGAERKAADANYTVQQGRYKAGLATVLEVQTALRDLARVRIDYVSASFDIEVAYRDLDNVLAIYETPRIDAAVQRLGSTMNSSPLLKLK